MNIYLEAEKELAIALGYTNFQRFESSGMPVSGHIDGVVTPLKQWTRDSAAAFDLMVEYELKTDIWKGCAWIGCSDDIWFQCEEILHEHGGSAKMALRYAIVKAVIAKLKGK